MTEPFECILQDTLETHNGLPNRPKSIQQHQPKETVMCDAATQQILETIVQKRTANGDMFTALDISREAQHQHAVQYRHNDLKGDIHRIYADGLMQHSTGQYDRSLVFIPGITTKVYLYHLVGADVSTYASIWAPGGPAKATATASGPQPIAVPPLTVQPPVTAPTAAPVASQPSAAQAAAAALSDFKVSSRGRLWLSRDILAKIGATPGNRVNVIKEGTSMIVAPVDPTATMPSKDLITDYLVDRHGNVALSSMCFKECGIDGESYYDVLEVNGKVVVKKV
jgi:hypothetical protein